MPPKRLEHQPSTDSASGSNSIAGELGSHSIAKELDEDSSDAQIEKRLKEDLNSSGGDIQSMDELEMTSRVSDDVSKVRSGCIRGLGKWPEPSKSIASDASCSSTANTELIQELASTKNELDTAWASLRAAEEKIHKLQETVEANQRMMMQALERIAPGVLQSLIGKPSSPPTHPPS